MRKYGRGFLFLLIFIFCAFLVSCGEISKTYSTEWSFDLYKHWHDALDGSGDTKDKENHVLSDWEIEVKPTKTTVGSISRTCSVCGEKETKTLPILTDSSYTVTTVDATCSSTGKKTYTWNQVHAVVIEEVLEKIPHSYGNYEIVTLPTTTTEGLAKRVCSCGAFETEVLPIINDDNYEITTLDATCTSSGSVTYILKSNNEISFETKISQAGHSFSSWVVNPLPTKDLTGIATRICSKDNQVEEITLPKLDDTNYDVELKNPTCKDKGLAKYTYKNDSSIVIEVELDIIDHNYSNWNIETKPTPSTLGSATRTCSILGEVETKELPILNEDNYNIVREESSYMVDGSITYTLKDDNNIVIVDVIPARTYLHDYEVINLFNGLGNKTSGHLKFINSEIDNDYKEIIDLYLFNNVISITTLVGDDTSISYIYLKDDAIYAKSFDCYFEIDITDEFKDILNTKEITLSQAINAMNYSLIGTEFIYNGIYSLDNFDVCYDNETDTYKLDRIDEYTIKPGIIEALNLSQTATIYDLNRGKSVTDIYSIGNDKHQNTFEFEAYDKKINIPDEAIFDEGKWSFSEDYSMATLTLTATNYDLTKEVDAYVQKEINGNITTYKASIEFGGKTYSTSIDVIEASKEDYDFTKLSFSWTEDENGYKAKMTLPAKESSTKEDIVKDADVTIIETKDATCTIDGYIKYQASVTLSNELKTDIYTKVIPSIGHSFTLDESSIKWSDDYKEATIRYICSNDNSHKEYETASTKRTGGNTGDVVYTAKFVKYSEYETSITVKESITLKTEPTFSSDGVLERTYETTIDGNTQVTKADEALKLYTTDEVILGYTNKTIKSGDYIAVKGVINSFDTNNVILASSTVDFILFKSKTAHIYHVNDNVLAWGSFTVYNSNLELSTGCTILDIEHVNDFNITINGNITTSLESTLRCGKYTFTASSNDSNYVIKNLYANNNLIRLNSNNEYELDVNENINITVDLKDVNEKTVFTKITNEADLVSDSEILLVCENKSTMSLSFNNNIFASIEANIDYYASGVKKVDDTGNAIPIKLIKDNGKWHFMVNNKYLAPGSGNTLSLVDEITDEASIYTITFDNGNAIITDSTSCVIKYNPSSPRFSKYSSTSGNTDIQIYQAVTFIGDIEYVAETSTSCMQSGNVSHYKITNNGNIKYYSDPYLKNELQESEIVVEKLNHNYTVTFEWNNDKSEAKAIYTCSVGGESKKVLATVTPDGLYLLATASYNGVEAKTRILANGYTFRVDVDSNITGFTVKDSESNVIDTTDGVSKTIGTVTIEFTRKEGWEVLAAKVNGENVTVTNDTISFTVSSDTVVEASTTAGFGAVSSTSEIESGGKYIIYSDNVALKNEITSNRAQYEEIYEAGSTIFESTPSIVWVITKIENQNNYTIYNEATNSYLASTGEKNEVKLAETLEDNCYWTISFNENGNAVIENVANSAAGINYTLRRNGTSGFACYFATTGSPLILSKYRFNNSVTNDECESLAYNQVELAKKLFDETYNETTTITLPKYVTAYDITEYNDNISYVEINGNEITFVVEENVDFVVSIKLEGIFKGGKYSTGEYDMMISLKYENSSYTFTEVTNVSQLIDGATIIIASETKAMSTTQNTSNRGQADFNPSSTSLPDDIQLITLVASDSNWQLKVGDKYLYAPSSKSNHLKTSTSKTAGDNGKWKIIIENGVTSIVAQGSSTRNDLRYNSDDGLFSCYASDSTFAKVKIYIVTSNQ